MHALVKQTLADRGPKAALEQCEDLRDAALALMDWDLWRLLGKDALMLESEIRAQRLQTASAWLGRAAIVFIVACGVLIWWMLT